ncbi:hypothetical protein CTAYLR_009041 [Chrysophaeum taylorii]|uniref:t-SNARE coiled-coil homology domain-containing protein n=1 Tax=Chrysophaeum taylorii TaxID=2483200 RepID=A0AAD7UJ27_9STRA|nr:hypothetical protein CTAYLR_009041 [Chrysophaeum taylorii]
MASSDVDYWCERYSEAVQEAKSLEKSTGAEGIERCESALKNARTKKKSFALELRLVRDREVKAQYGSKMAALDAQCEEVEAAISRARLLEGAAAHEVSSGNGNLDYLEAADRLQDQTEESLGRTLKLVEASREVGESTLSEQQRQREQLTKISDDVTRIEDNLARADKLIRNFTKRMLGDRMIQILAFLNFVAFFVVIVYVVFTGKGINTNDSKKDNPSIG